MGKLSASSYAGPALGLVASAAGTGTVLALLGRHYWIFELFSHFPLHYLVGQVFAIAGFLALRWRVAAVIVAVTALPNVGAVAAYLPGTLRPASAASDPSAAISLVAANILYLNRDFDAVRDYLAAKRPDIVVLTEYSPRWRKALLGLDVEYSHFVALPRATPWGMAIYSRFPIREYTHLDLSDGDAVNLRTILETPAGPLELWGIHLASPMQADRAAMRDAQLAEMTRLLSGEDNGLPKILIGDFNTTAFSPRFKDLLAGTGLRDARLPFGLQVTWPHWPVPLWIAIDQVLVNEHVSVQRVASGPGVSSDHWPVEVEFSLR